MKYGETLRQRSIPAWSHHNIDYDDVKNLIKEQTTPGKGKSIAVPGRGDDKLAEFEASLFLILRDQHDRINLFVKSKAGEIQRRLDHSKKQFEQLASRRSTIDSRIPVSRLQRYGRLENDVVKAGDEIRSLARFTATQRTAFRKLLKKYKKWTGSVELEDRFRDEVLDDPKSFAKLDLGPLLDDYSHTQQNIRALYDSQLQRSAGGLPSPAAAPSRASSSTIKQLQDAVDSASKVHFDTSIATVPLGENGTFASYFVHPENVVELQMLLLQYARYYFSRSRNNSVATPVSPGPQNTSFTTQAYELADYHMLVADNLDRFVREQNSLTVDDREHLRGSFPQRAKASVRWNHDEDALTCLRSRSGRTKSAYLKRKHVHDFFDVDAEFAAKQDTSMPDSVETVEELRRELLKDSITPLFQYTSCRSRLHGLDDGSDGLVLATLDTNILIEKAGVKEKVKSNFPFALLLVRQEGSPKSDLLSVLNDSHLVERVRGFSLECHSIWQTHRPESMTAPFWVSMLTRDIRKLPPPMLKGTGLAQSGSSGAQTVRSHGSSSGATDSTTAVEQTSPLRLEVPQLRSFRNKKKKRRGYAAEETNPERYWSEYDHPEDGDPSEDAYVIYIDPNEKSTLEHLFEKLTSLFRKKEPEQEALLSTPVSPREDELSSDDEELGVARATKRGFGTFGESATQSHAQVFVPVECSSLSQFTGTCFAASVAILVVAYVLHSTGRKKLLREVHFGVLFAILCSLAFVLVGFMAIMRNKKPLSYSAWIISITVLLVDTIGSGGLIAWMVG